MRHASFVLRPRLLSATLAALVVLAAGAAHATEVGSSRTFGLGASIGTATSLEGKYFLDRESALTFGLSFWPYRGGCWRDRRGVRVCDGYAGAYRNRGFGVHGDFIWQENIVRRRLKLDWHIGVGGRFWRFDDDYYYYDDDRHTAFAARMPLGLDLTFARPSFLEVFAEVVPSLYLSPIADFDVEAFLGVRLYF
jgi:hypothetical protein